MPIAKPVSLLQQVNLWIINANYFEVVTLFKPETAFLENFCRVEGSPLYLSDQTKHVELTKQEQSMGKGRSLRITNNAGPTNYFSKIQPFTHKSFDECIERSQ